MQQKEELIKNDLPIQFTGNKYHMQKYLELTFVSEVVISCVRALAGGGSSLNSSNKWFGTKVGSNSIAVLCIRVWL